MKPDRRRYVDPCGIARALDVVGERWALLVVRELLLGPRRFGRGTVPVVDESPSGGLERTSPAAIRFAFPGATSGRSR